MLFFLSSLKVLKVQCMCAVPLRYSPSDGGCKTSVAFTEGVRNDGCKQPETKRPEQIAFWRKNAVNILSLNVQQPGLCRHPMETWASSRNPYQCFPFSMRANSDTFCITRSSGWGSSHDALGIAHRGIIKPCVDAHRAPPARAAQGFAAAGIPTVPTCSCLWGGGHWMSVFGLCDSSSLSSVASSRSEWPCFSCRLGWAELARSGCAPRAACYRTAAGLCADTCKASVSASS